MRKNMKKFIFLTIVIITQGLSAISIADIWRCRPSNPDASCSSAKRQEAATYFNNAKLDALKTLSADLRALGIVVSPTQLQKEQEYATPEEIQQRSGQFKEIQQRLDEMQRQRQKTMEYIAG